MAIDRTRYRQLDFIGARILQARELNWLQEIDQGVAVSDNETSVSGQLQAVYRQGALFNVTVNTSGLVVTLSATDSSKPMMIFVRNQWEIFPGNNDDVTGVGGTFPGNHSITLGSTGTNIFLNWELKIRTGGLIGDDSSLTDATTNEAVASAGELILHLSTTDTSASSLSPDQLAKNVSPVSVLAFTNTGSVLSYVPSDNVGTQARASSITSGLVKSTTNTPIVVSTDDPRMSDTRPAADGSVHDASVRVPVPTGGTNADGTPTYNLTSDIGGISAAKIIYTVGTQLVSDAIAWIKGQLNSLLSRYNAHETAGLGLSNTHPIPTAAQVGATPLSHVGQALNLPTSHPAVANQDSGGMKVNRSGSGGSVDDPAFGVFVSGSPIVSLNHDGDISSNAAAVFTATPGGSLASGALKHLSLVAQVLSQHVNQVSHANPHGLTAGDIGAASISYVDTAIANVLAAAENYANSINPGMSVRGESVPGSFWTVFRWAPNSGVAIEIAVSAGGSSHGNTIFIPSGFTTGAAFITVAPRFGFDGNHPAHGLTCATNITSVSSWAVTMFFRDGSGNTWFGDVNWMALGWRIIS